MEVHYNYKKLDCKFCLHESLKLSSVKQGETEVIAFGNKDEVLKVNAYLDSRGQTTKNQVRNLGVILETDLSFSSHVKAVTKSAYYHLKTLQELDVCFQSRETCSCLYHQQGGLL